VGADKVDIVVPSISILAELPRPRLTISASGYLRAPVTRIGAAQRQQWLAERRKSYERRLAQQ
jgi:hypothetical protein